MRVLTTGSTTWTDGQALRRELSTRPAGSTMATGDMPDIGALAITLAPQMGSASWKEAVSA